MHKYIVDYRLIVEKDSAVLAKEYVESEIVPEYFAYNIFEGDLVEEEDTTTESGEQKTPKYQVVLRSYISSTKKETPWDLVKTISERIVAEYPAVVEAYGGNIEYEGEEEFEEDIISTRLAKILHEKSIDLSEAPELKLTEEQLKRRFEK